MTSAKVPAPWLASSLAVSAQKAETKTPAQVSPEISAEILSFLNQPDAGGKAIKAASLADLVAIGTIRDVE